MAASHSYLRYVDSGPRTREPQRQPAHAESVRLVLGFRRILIRLACPFHEWNWPRPIPGERPEGFDAHQTCFKCMTERFYDTRMLQAGPLYRSLVPGTADSPFRGLVALLGFRRPKPAR
ncbi:MAG: hypothetical protein WBE72_20285 [Terracidiphilus sp.]